MGFGRIRFKACGDELVSDWVTDQREGWEPGPVMAARKMPWFPVKCVERNSAGGGLTRDAVDMEVPVEYLRPVHTSIVEWMHETHGAKPYDEGGDFPQWGSYRTEGSIEQFEWVIETYQPRKDGIVAPLGRELEGEIWNHAYVEDGAQRGEVLARVWQIGTKNIAPIHCFVEGPVNHPLCTVRARYRQFGINPIGYVIGIVDFQDVPHFIGLEVWIRSDIGAGLCA